MTTDNKYNGWSNYETWRINLELFDYFDISDYSKDSYDLSKQLEDYVEEIIFIDVRDGELGAIWCLLSIIPTLPIVYYRKSISRFLQI